MKLDQGHSLKEIAELIERPFKGDPDHSVTGINEIHVVEDGDLVFVDHPKYYDKALGSAATTILINKEVELPEGKAIIISEDPFDDFVKLIGHFRPKVHSLGSIGNDAFIDPSAIIHKGVYIGDRTYIGKGVELHPNVVVYNDVIIEDHAIIHANTVLGSHAFYYQKREGKYVKFPSCGRLVIRKNVEIGASCTIDKGVTGDTIIGEGSKLDNHVHIGHDTVVGKHCLLAAQVGLAGCVHLEDNVTLWGQVGVASDVVIGEGATVYAQSGTNKDLEADGVYFGSPAGEAREKFKELVALKKLPDALKSLKK